MEQVRIPGADLKVSRIALGTWAIGGWMWGGTDEDRSVRTILAAVDKGINLIDTASIYGFGRSEEIVGKAVAENKLRDKVFISTKTALDREGEQPFRNASPDFIRKDVEDSLRKLRTDHIDILYIHWPDPLTPFEETARRMKGLLDEGKIRAVGLSNFSPEQVRAFKEECPVHVLQPPYNLFEREIEGEILPFSKKNNLPLMTYGVLCRGLLSGKMSEDREFKGDDLRKYDPKFQQPRFGQYLNAVGELEELAKDRFGKGVLHLAVRWVLDRGVEIALWGGRRPEQMDPVPDIMGWRIDEATMAEIDRILKRTIVDPVGPEFMAPPTREQI